MCEEIGKYRYLKDRKIGTLFGIVVVGLLITTISNDIVGNAAATWDTSATLMSNTDTIATSSDIACDEQDVYMVWLEKEIDTGQNPTEYTYMIQFDYSTDGGASWESSSWGILTLDTLVTTQANQVLRHPAVAAAGGVVHVVWSYTDGTTPTNDEVRHAEHDEYPEEAFEYTVAYSPGPSDPYDMRECEVDVNSEGRYDERIVWRAYDGSNWNIYFWSTDYGPTEVSPTSPSKDEIQPDIATTYYEDDDEQYTYIVWEVDQTGNNCIQFVESTDGLGEEWGTVQTLSSLSGGSPVDDANYPSISAKNEYVHVTWQDDRPEPPPSGDTSDEIYCLNNDNAGDSGDWTGSYSGRDGNLVPFQRVRVLF